MQQITGPNLENLSNIGYYSSKEQRIKEYNENETHRYKQGPLNGVKVSMHKLTNDIFTYFPKAFKGSKNSDFYEYLSMGMVPYLVGSATLIGLSNAANGLFNNADKSKASALGKRMGVGVVLYGLGKIASKKLSRTLIQPFTSVNLDETLLDRKIELPEPGQDKGFMRTRYPGVFDSIQFFRKDKIEQDCELKYDDRFHDYNVIAKKAGYTDNQNDSGQIASKKIQQLKARATALENVSKYATAALGVVYGYQEAFGNLKLSIPKNMKELKGNAINNLEVFKEAGKQLWKGNNRNIFTKHGGKAMIFASLATTALAAIIPVIGFKTNPNTMKSKVDNKKEYEVL